MTPTAAERAKEILGDPECWPNEACDYGELRDSIEAAILDVERSATERATLSERERWKKAVRPFVEAVEMYPHHANYELYADDLTIGHLRALAALVTAPAVSQTPVEP